MDTEAVVEPVGVCGPIVAIAVESGDSDLVVLGDANAIDVVGIIVVVIVLSSSSSSSSSPLLAGNLVVVVGGVAQPYPLPVSFCMPCAAGLFLKPWN